RPSRNDAGACARGQTGRPDRDGRVRGARERHVARALARAHAGRLAAAGPAGVASVARSRPLPRAEHRAALPSRSRRRRAVARRGDRGGVRAADELRRRPRNVGSQAVTTVERPAFYALRPGGWRDLVTVLHPPYTAWHLSYVALGAAAAPAVHADRLGAAL